MNEEFNFESIKTKALEQLKSGKSLLGKDGQSASVNRIVKDIQKDAENKIS